ncbi:hypothetical protein F5883DRAFT_656317 [Diaporthe sp. PMI_573]|nr:hypothetical protein F5883DRAFT_656317 [Diaporthaceae sp. PMI_573]
MVLNRRFFFTESLEVYRIARNWKGLFDYGPPGCALQANLVDAWKKHFVLEENMLELDYTVITPEPALKTSGQVDKFADWMCKYPGPDRDSRKSSEATVAEYNNILAKIENYDGDQSGELIKRLDIRNPVGNGEALPPVPFNPMIKSTVGPSSAAHVYLRPETTQGQFLNFKKLIDYNQSLMPFASASVEKSYRNEIAPRSASSLLRVREFLMAEIEHYVDPDTKDHGRLSELIGVESPLLDRETQPAGRTEPRVLLTVE